MLPSQVLWSNDDDVALRGRLSHGAAKSSNHQASINHCMNKNIDPLLSAGFLKGV
ncbi:hypothetical protein N836_33550 [Leptolyngbya sp. Heron Island J]|nr:hypothetical protein N836_33550 [Leptolyngbya sp. Heron Island J]